MNQLKLGLVEGSRYTRGKVSSLRVYGHCLTGPEVNSLYKINKGEWSGEASLNPISAKLAELEARLAALEV